MRALVQTLQRWDDALTTYQKVLLANAAILMVGAFAGIALTLRVVSSGGSLVATFVPFVLGGLAAQLAANTFLLWLAFSPLFRLREVMERVRAGDFRARVPVLRGDPDIREMGDTLNLMLNRLDAHRKGVSSMILTAQEEERRRIARDLHDQTSQDLTRLLLNLELVARALPADAPEAKRRIEETRDLTEQTLEEVRRIILELRPSILDDLGLVPAVRAMARDALEPRGIQWELVVSGDLGRLDGGVGTVVFRIAQEAIANVARHSEASRVRVAIERRGDEIELLVEDDGVGFEPAAAYPRDGRYGFGVFGMQERARLIGGDLIVDSAPGRGTRIRAAVPAQVRAEQVGAVGP